MLLLVSVSARSSTCPVFWTVRVIQGKGKILFPVWPRVTFNCISPIKRCLSLVQPQSVKWEAHVYKLSLFFLKVSLFKIIGNGREFTQYVKYSVCSIKELFSKFFLMINLDETNEFLIPENNQK